MSGWDVFATECRVSQRQLPLSLRVAVVEVGASSETAQVGAVRETTRILDESAPGS